MAVPFDQLPPCSAARTVAISGIVSTRPTPMAAQTGPGGVPLGDLLRVQLSGGSGAGAKLVCILEGSRGCASQLHQSVSQPCQDDSPALLAASDRLSHAST